MSMTTERFEEIWIEHFKPLSRYIYSHVYNKSDVEDILQQVAVKALSGLKALKDMDKAKQWLLRIASNTIIDYYRKLKREPNFIELDKCVDIPASERNPILMDIKEYGNKLPVKKRSFLLLIIQQNMTIREVSQILGIGYSTARKWHKDMAKDLSKILC